MAKNDILRARGLHHGGRNLARISTLLLVCAILGAQAYQASIQHIGHRSQMNEGSADNHVAIGLVGLQRGIQLSGQSHTFLQVQVHFPVTCYNFLSHVFLF